MTTTKTRAERARESAAQAILKAEQEDRVAALLPEEPCTIYAHQDHNSATFQPIKLEELGAFVHTFLPHIIEAEHWEDGCTSVRPVEINKTATRKDAVMDGVSFAEITLNSYGSRGEYQDAELVLWLRIKGEIIQAHVKIEPTPYQWLPRRDLAWYRGTVTNGTIEPRYLGENQRRKWWSELPAYRISYYWADKANFLSWLTTKDADENNTEK
jgi:hypothetical protein